MGINNFNIKSIKKYSRLRYWLNAVKTFFIRLVKEHCTNHEIALGTAIGTFMAAYPTFGIGVIAILLLNKLIRFNTAAALGMSIISNPFTSPFFLVSSFQVGSYIFQSDITFSLDTWQENIKETGVLILIGGLVVSGICAVIAYAITYKIITYYRNRKQYKNKII